MLFVALAFMIFRAPDIATVGHMGTGLIGAAGAGSVQFATWMLLALAAALAVLRWPNPDAVDRFLKPQPALALLTAVVATYILAEVGRGAPTSFIYFQF